MTATAVNLQVRLRTRPLRNLPVGRALRERILPALDAAGIAKPAVAGAGGTIGASIPTPSTSPPAPACAPGPVRPWLTMSSPPLGAREDRAEVAVDTRQRLDRISLSTNR